MEEEIHVFVIENQEKAEEIMDRYLKPKDGGITYAAIIPKTDRQRLVDAIDGVQSGKYEPACLENHDFFQTL